MARRVTRRARISSSRCRPTIFPTFPPTPASSSNSSGTGAASRCGSEVRAAGEEGLGAPADPDRAVRVLVDLDPAIAAEPRPLRGDIRCGGKARAQQPLRGRGIEAAGHRIFEHGAVMVAEEDPDLVGDLRAGRMRADDAEVEPLAKMTRRLEREHLGGGAEPQADPARPVVGPARLDDRAAVDVEHAGELGDLVLIDRTL